MPNTTVNGPRLPRIRKRAHRCYELAGRGQQRDPSWTLVHGTLESCIGHAWLEKEGTVYDRFMPIAQYIEEYAALAERRYSAKEAAEAMLSAKRATWGPWHKTDAARFASIE